MRGEDWRTEVEFHSILNAAVIFPWIILWLYLSSLWNNSTYRIGNERPSRIRLKMESLWNNPIKLEEFLHLLEKKILVTKFSDEFCPLVIKTNRHFFPPCRIIHCFSFFLPLKLTGLICSWNWGQSWFRNSPMRQKGFNDKSISLFLPK